MGQSQIDHEDPEFGTDTPLPAGEGDDDLFDPDAAEFEGEEFDDDEDEDEEEESVEVPEILPTLPAVLFYDSTSHGKRRFYVNSLKGKPEWTYEKDGAYVFENADHLKLAGSNCKHYGYTGLDFETIT